MVIRIGGLASGMDIEGIVNDLMRVERIRVDKVSQDKTLLEWTREAYNDINKKFASFILNTRQSFGLTQTSGGTIVNRSVSSFNWIKSATVGNSGIADVSARSNAVNGSYQLHVHGLASNWSAASSEEITVDGGGKSNIKEQLGLDNDIVQFSITTNKGDKTFMIETSKSLKEVVKEINSADLGVTAIYDESIDRFFIQTNETGEKNTITIQDMDGFFSKLKLQHNVDGNSIDVDLTGSEIYRGTDAIIDFEGANNISMSSNQFTINNISIHIKSVGETTIHVNTDENAIVDKIKDFVHQYNELVDELNDVLGQKQYRDYRPLTEEQKKAMSEKEIELWEERAKSGLLRNDPLLSRTMQTVRSGLYGKVSDVVRGFSHLTEIGIQTERYVTGSMGGKLEINEDQLRDAIRRDVDGVLDLLFKESPKEVSDPNEKREKTGLIGRLYGDMVDGMKGIIVKAGPGEDSQMYRSINPTMLLDFVTKHSSISMLDKNIMDYDKRIFELERRLIDRENQYWAKFSAMETALNRMYSQGDWLYHQFSNM